MQRAHAAYLSAGVPATRILAAAARKAWRAARARLSEEAAWPARDELLAGSGCAHPAALAERLRAPGRGLVAPDSSGISSALRSLFPAETARLVARADRAASGRLIVFGREAAVGRPGGGTDWQLDALHGCRFDAGAPSGALPSPPGADVKAAWAVGRGEQWVALGCGAIAEPARESELAEAFVASVRDFVEQNPIGRGAQWASPMEAALRIVCLGQAHALLAGAAALATPRYAVDVAALTVGTARFVLSHLEDAHVVPNNHLAADWVGLLACAALLPEWHEARRWRELGARNLARELAAQTHADGTTFEGSVPYQRLAVEIFTAGAILARRAGAPLPGAYWARLARLYAAARDLLSSTGELPQIGDNDSGRVLAFRARAPLEGAYLLPLGAAVLGDPGLLVRDGLADAEEALWLCGGAAVERLQGARPGPPPRSASFPDGGFHVLRRGQLEVAISCGRNGQRGVGGHSHNDKLAFELRLRGRLTVCDPGSPRYTGDPELRARFRSTRAHATVLVDGREQAPIPRGRPFALPDAARAVRLAFESGTRERFAGEHHGYARRGVVHRREIELLEGAVRVCDELGGAGVHLVELRFPFPTPDARARALGACEQDRLAALGVPGALQPGLGVEFGPPEAPVALVVVLRGAELEARVEPASYSPGYAELVPACAGTFSGRIACPAAITTYLLDCVGGAQA